MYTLTLLPGEAEAGRSEPQASLVCIVVPTRLPKERATMLALFCVLLPVASWICLKSRELSSLLIKTHRLSPC